MAEKDPIFSTKVKYTGIWDFKQIYRFLYDWFSDNGYKVKESGYTEKIKPDGKELEIKWEASKKISDYFKFSIKADWLILGMTETEVQKEGAKMKMNKGYLEIKFSAVLVKDYEHRWENTAFLKFLRGVYDRYIIKGRIESYEDKLLGEIDELIAQAKSFLAIEGKQPPRD
jgi:hypothetical protein